MECGRFNVQTQICLTSKSSINFLARATSQDLSALYHYNSTAISHENAGVMCPQSLQLCLQISRPTLIQDFVLDFIDSHLLSLPLDVRASRTFLTLFWCLRLTIFRSRLLFLSWLVKSTLGEISTESPIPKNRTYRTLIWLQLLVMH